MMSPSWMCSMLELWRYVSWTVTQHVISSPRKIGALMTIIARGMKVRMQWALSQTVLMCVVVVD